MLRKRKKSPHNLKVRGSNPLPATNFTERVIVLSSAARFALLNVSLTRFDSFPRRVVDHAECRHHLILLAGGVVRGSASGEERHVSIGLSLLGIFGGHTSSGADGPTIRPSIMMSNWNEGAEYRINHAFPRG